MRLEVGRIAAAHGIHGELRVEVWDPEIPLKGRELYLEGDDEPRRVLGVKNWKAGAILALEGIVSRNEAEGLAGRRLYGEASQAPSLGAGRFYVHELVGCLVYNEQEELLGTLQDVQAGPAQDLWIAEGPSGRYLIPAVRATVLAVDLIQRRITVRGGGVLGPDAAR
ncbi:MAG: ribosome maturation factor RimM [Thermaerobacter sp.]|nr:ribosome maturation factor RimM [Thermaerobacter sp.]